MKEKEYEKAKLNECNFSYIKKRNVFFFCETVIIYKEKVLYGSEYKNCFINQVIDITKVNAENLTTGRKT